MQPLPAARRVGLALLVLLATLLPGLGCGSRPSYDGNPPSLWVNYSTREIDLVLVDYEPPPY